MPEDDDTLDTLDQAALDELMAADHERPVDLERERKFRERANYYAELNTALVRGDNLPLLRAYILLRNRVTRLELQIEHGMTRPLIDKEHQLLRQSLDTLDPRWREDWWS